MQLPLQYIYVQVHINRLINGTHYMFKNKFKKFKLYMIILQLFYFMKLIMSDKKKMYFVPADLVIFGCVREVLYQ